MRSELSRFLAGLALLPALLASPSRADEVAAKGRAIFRQNQAAVVTVQILVKSVFSMTGLSVQTNESRQDITGTVLDPSGLTVLSLSLIDPAQLVKNMTPAMAAAGSKLKVESELSDVAILSADGVRSPAEVVLRDTDLDLGFIRPKSKPGSPMSAVELNRAGKAEILDPVIALNRLGNAAGRAYAAAVERISAIVSGPRSFYIPETSLTTTSLGAPAFTLDGKFLGVFAMRSSKAASNSGLSDALSLQSESFAGIIIPAEDIQKAAQRVLPRAAEKKGE